MIVKKRHVSAGVVNGSGESTCPWVCKITLRFNGCLLIKQGVWRCVEDLFGIFNPRICSLYTDLNIKYSYCLKLKSRYLSFSGSPFLRNFYSVSETFISSNTYGGTSLLGVVFLPYVIR